MTKNVNELVLDAFYVEHREQLEQLRTLIASLRPGDKVADDPRVRDAFRLAHSFKGGARVCDLREAERLSHCLESVLEQLGQGQLEFSTNVATSITLTLDTIEDWMAALEGELPLPDTSDTLKAIEQTLNGPSAPRPATADPSKKRSRLFSVFSQEYAQHSARLRHLLAEWNGANAAPDGEQILEATRLAHTLAGAAAIVDLPAVETVARQLENLFRSILGKDAEFDAENRRRVATALDQMAGAMGEQVDAAPARNASDEQRPAELSGPTEPIARAGDAIACGAPSVPSACHETVRVAVESLDRLMRSSSELSIDNQHVARLTRQVLTLQVEVSDFERERETIRRAASSSIHKMAATPEFARIARYLDYVDRQLANLVRRTSTLSVEHRQVAWQLQARSGQVQRDVHEARLVPAHNVFQGFRKMVRDLAKSEGKEIEFEAAGLDVRADRMVLQELKDPIMHVLRNSVSHGIELPQLRKNAGKPAGGRVRMSLEVANGRLNVVIDDDGAGIDVEEMRQQAIKRGLVTDTAVLQQSNDELMRVVFEPGFSTADSVTELAGRGMGLSIVHDTVVRLQGQVKLLPNDNAGLQVSISVPLFVSTHRMLLVACGHQILAIPTQGVEQLLLVPADKIESVEGQPVITHERSPIRLVRLCDVLGLPSLPTNGYERKSTPVVLLKSGARRLAVSVEALMEVREALIMNLDEYAATSGLAGGILLDDGQVALVIRPAELFEAATDNNRETKTVQSMAIQEAEPGRVLIVDDSFTTRTLEKSILETQGYNVSVAIDGVEALSLLRQQKFGLVISDVEMPRMDGFTLLEQIKTDRRLANTPVILVTSRDRQEDQQHGLELGADAYIVKRKFDHQELLNTIRQLI
jgi:two-component system chemotaxis sensor kinase CheA